MCTPLSAGRGKRGLMSLRPNFQKGEGGLNRILIFLEGGCWERRGDFFQGGGGVQFYIKNKLKSEIFNDEKSL